MNEELAFTSPPSSDTPMGRNNHCLRSWIAQQARNDATRTAFVAWLGLRLYCTCLGVVLYNLLPPAFVDEALQIVFGKEVASCPQYTLPATRLNAALAGMWLRWDTPWYVDIARHGYSCYGSTAFMPLYPVLIRGIGFLLGGNMLVAALLISSIASFAALYLLYQLAKELSGSAAIARASVAAFALFPVSFFLMSGYTEALFLALAIGAYSAARRDHWLPAGLLAALATLTRLQGILLLVPLGLELWLVYRDDLRRWQSWFALLLAPLALAAYSLFIWLTQGIFPPWEPLSSARGPWHLHYAWPWSGMLQDLSALVSQPDLGTFLSFKLLDPLTALIIGCCTFIAFRRLNPSLGAFLVVMWLSSVIKISSQGYTTSVSRYMLAQFPAFIVLGMLLIRWPRLVRLSAALASVLLMSIYLSIFLLWGWVA